MTYANQFGGYWRTRAYSQTNFSGDDSEAKDLQRVDTRTRLYYTAKLSDNLKLVNKFEMVAADLFAGDATGDEDPMELGARLSLAF